ncbi:cell filamentation protein Fic [Sphingobium lactosutens DS20]|nr:cell filamentation protein Fic [Sphingobium indicum IP26]EQB08634.1 cell filamentation protein Fic [Sphingobium sp. HDIP04]EQB12963.1 cell filamentation protein Fic [Sphingobium lactosutens DS20]SKC02309.1 cell filamentation protein [Sphingopyxis flava]SKC15007.1 cell filamentation protein [Rhizorhabdus histidinilytica]
MTAREYGAIHKHMFQDVYEWAGRFRTVDISKPGSTFARAHFIARSMDHEFRQLPDLQTLKSMDRDRFADTMARHISELNAIHPFREGNGRTMRLHLQLHSLAAEKFVSIQAMGPMDWMEASRDSFHTGNHASLAKVIRDAMPQEQSRREPARGPAGIAMPPAMDSLMPAGERRAMSIEQAKEQINRYLPTAQAVAARQYEQLNRLAATSGDMRQLAERSAQELAFFRDPKGPLHHVQIIEQRRYHQIEVNWAEGMDPLQRVRAISAGAASFLDKMSPRDVQAADRALRMQVMPPGVSQVDLRLAEQFQKNSPEQNRDDARLAPFQIAIDKRVADAVGKGASKEQLAAITESAKSNVVSALREGKIPTQKADKPKDRER